MSFLSRETTDSTYSDVEGVVLSDLDEEEEEDNIEMETYSNSYNSSFDIHEYFYINRAILYLDEFDSSFLLSRLILILHECGDVKEYMDGNTIMILVCKILEKGLLYDEGEGTYDIKPPYDIDKLSNHSFRWSSICLTSMISKKVLTFCTSKTNIYLKYNDGDRSKGIKSSWKNTKLSFIYEYQIECCKEWINRFKNDEDKFPTLSRLWDFLIMKCRVIKRGISTSVRETVKDRSLDIENMSLNTRKISSFYDEGIKNKKTSLWNHLYNDNEIEGMRQLQILISCHDIILNKRVPPIGGYFNNKKKDEDNDDMVDYAYVTVSISDGKKAEKTSLKPVIFTHNVTYGHHTICKDCPIILSGNVIESHVSELPLNFLHDNKVWHRLATTSRCSLNEYLYFPCSLLLHLDNCITPDHIIRFELCIRSGNKTLETYGYCEMTLEILEGCLKPADFELFSLLDSDDYKGKIRITLIPPIDIISYISTQYHLIEQSYHFLNLNNEVISVNEYCLEDSCTWHIPYLYFLMRGKDMNNIILNTDSDEDKEVYELMLSQYHECVKLFESEWLNLEIPKVGPRSFKPSTSRHIMGLEGIPINLHLYMMEVITTIGKDVYDMVTMGSPAVHTGNNKEGGLRKLIQTRLDLRENGYKKNLSGPISQPVTPRSSKIPIRNSVTPNIKQSISKTLPLSARLSMGPKKYSTLSPHSSTTAVEPKKYSTLSPPSSTAGISKMFSFISEGSESNEGKESVSSTTLCSRVDPSISVLYSGYLEKRGNVITGSKRRYFILTDTSLEYYKSDTSVSLQGHILLNTITNVMEKTSADNTFDIITNDRIFSLTASTHEDMKLWFNLLKAEIVRRGWDESEVGYGTSVNSTTVNLNHEICDDLNLYNDMDIDVHNNILREGRWKTEIVIYTGWMYIWIKSINQWKRYFFRLYKSILRCFKSELDVSSIFIIDMLSIINIEYNISKKEISLFGNNSQVYILRPSYESSYCDRWYHDICTCSINGKPLKIEEKKVYRSIVDEIKDGDFETCVPDECILHDVYMENIRYRLDLATSQILSATVLCFIKRLEVLIDSNIQQLLRLYELGFLVQVESLLSTSFKEQNMLEDTDIAVKELRMVRLCLMYNEGCLRNERNSIDIKRVNHQVIVEIWLKDIMWNKLPLPMKSMKYIPIIPILFTQGINEMQWLSNTMGNTSLQVTINQENLIILLAYVESVREYHKENIDRRDGLIDTSCLMRAKTYSEREIEMEDILYNLKKAVNDESVNNEKNNYDILNLSGRLVRELGGGRITCCKSGKDRTALSCTMEYGRLLRDKYYIGLPSDDKHKNYIKMLRMYRIYGVRLAIARKNIGTPTFAFNHLQRKMLPLEYRPPMISCTGTVKS